MKKVIILCSALVFDFLTCSDASAYNAKYEAKTIEDELTTLIGLVNGQEEKEAIVQSYAKKIKKLANSQKQMWMGSSDLVIVDGKVEFTKKFEKGIAQTTQPHRGRAKNEVDKILNEIKGQILLLAQEQRENETHPEPANIIPWSSSQNSSSRRDYARDNHEIGGRSSGPALPAPDNRIDGESSRRALPAPDNRIDGESSRRALPAPDNRIDGESSRRALPAPDNRIDEESSRRALSASDNRIDEESSRRTLPASDNRIDEESSRRALSASDNRIDGESSAAPGDGWLSKKESDTEAHHYARYGTTSHLNEASLEDQEIFFDQEAQRRAEGGPSNPILEIPGSNSNPGIPNSSGGSASFSPNSGGVPTLPGGK